MLAIGTALLSTGMFRCAQLVEGSTKERVFSRSSSSIATSRLYWVQPGTQFIGDQAFDSFAYSHPSNQFNRYITSWKDTGVAPKTLALSVALGSTVVGFALQFLGLRACHSTVAVAQLALTMLMSMVRSWLRSSRLAEREVHLADCPELYAGSELDWLALYIGHIDLPRCQRKWMVSPRQSYQNVESVTTTLKESRLVHTYFGNEETAVLSGFVADKVADQVGSWDYGWGTLWRALETWRFRHHFLTNDQYISDRPAMEETGAAFLYRARLAQLTVDWDDQLVRVRSVARSLARAIEATGNLLFTADGIVLEDGWDAPFVIYWAVPCEMTTDSVCPSSHITPGNQAEKPLYLSLKRSVDRGGQVSGEWSVDALELEAMLGLWAWSMRDSYKPYDVIWRIAWISETNGNMLGSRIEEFRSWDGSSWPISQLPSREFGDPTVFGWHHIPAQMESDSEVIAFMIEPRSKPTIYAQELFSIFFASILHIVRDLGGTTTKTGKGEIRNTNITQIQKAFTDNGLGSVHDAMTCIFPALKLQGKLPQVR
jgi:hypothetical protein